MLNRLKNQVLNTAGLLLLPNGMRLFLKQKLNPAESIIFNCNFLKNLN